MRKIRKTLSELSGGYDEEDQQLLNPDDKPADFGISLTQLRQLTKVRFTANQHIWQYARSGLLGLEVVTDSSCAEKRQRGSCSAGRRLRSCRSPQVRPQFRLRHSKLRSVVHTKTEEVLWCKQVHRS